MLLYKSIKHERGDIYFEYLICLFIFIAVLSISLQVVSAVQLKFWLDGRTAAILREVQITGEISESTDALIGEVAAKLGESTAVEWDARFIGAARKIQLGEPIRLQITGETVLFSFGRTGGVTITISSEAVGTSAIYWKDP
jgi:hypothetical protein